MLILRFEPEPFAAVLGIMLYPGDDEQHRARAFTAQFLAEPVRRYLATGRSLDREVLELLATTSGAKTDDAEDRYWWGTATGNIFKMYYVLSDTDPKRASWNNAVRIVEQGARQSGHRAGRTALWNARSRFLRVSHLWAAWAIRGCNFLSCPGVGYDAVADVMSFLAEAEILRQWGQTWRAPRDKAKPPLPNDVWRTPDDWQPPERQLGWPKTGVVPIFMVSDDALQELRSAGRPAKSP